MAQHRLWMGSIFLLALFAAPRAGHAGIGELIWEMSGPQMIGGGIECKFRFDGDLERCYVVAPVGAAKYDKGRAVKRRFRFSIEGGAYVSTGKDASGQDFLAGRTYMMAFDPMLEFVTWTCGENIDGSEKVAIYHGILGASYNVLFGSGFDPFTNVALKLRPIGIKLGRIAVEYNVRLYPNGFSSEDFGRVPVVAEPSRAESVHSISVGIALPKKP